MKRPLALLAVLGIAAILFAQQHANSIDDAMLRAAGKTQTTGREWITYGGNYAETRFSPLKQITAENVNRLGLAWSVATESPAGGRIEATPLMSNGVLYATLAWDVIVAIDARTGKLNGVGIRRFRVSTFSSSAVAQ